VTPRRVLAVALTLAPLAACKPPAGAAPPISAQGSLAFLADGDTTVIDEYSRSADLLDGMVRILSREPGGPTVRATYRVRYDRRGRAASAQLAIQQISAGGTASTAQREWTLTFDAEGRATETESGGRRIEARAGEGVLPLFGPSIAMLESVLLRARSTGATRIPVFHLAAAGRVDTVAIAWVGGDSATVMIAGATGRYRLDPAGRILGGRAEEEQLETVRID
jgi:hypothetical protein